MTQRSQTHSEALGPINLELAKKLIASPRHQLSDRMQAQAIAEIERLRLTPAAAPVGMWEALADAYQKGAEDVHAEWLRAHEAGEGPPRGDPEFGEAAGDYADAALDPFNSAALTPPVQEIEAPARTEEGDADAASAGEVEPVAWMYERSDGRFFLHPSDAGFEQEDRDFNKRKGWTETSLYATPQPSGQAMQMDEASALRIGWWNDMRDRGVSQEDAIAKINAALSAPTTKRGG